MSVVKTETTKVQNIKELEEYCKKLTCRLLGQDRILILLTGDLGSGKTKTVETLLHQFGVTQVSSPTFAIHHNYQAEDFNIDHFDLYRVESESDLESTGFWDVFLQVKGWVVVEWADRLVHQQFPPHWVRVEIEIERLGEERIIKTNFY